MTVQTPQSVRASGDTYQIIATSGNGKGAVDIMLPLDFAYGPKDSEKDSPRNQQVTDIDCYYTKPNCLRSYYAQVYVSFDTFKRAAKKIFAEYKENIKGYTNFMRYWAHNGEYNWIGSTEEYAGHDDENAGYHPRYHFKLTTNSYEHVDKNGNKVDDVAKIDYFENYGAVEIIKHGWNDTAFWNNYDDTKSPMKA